MKTIMQPWRALLLCAALAAPLVQAAPSTLDTSFGGGTGKVFSNVSGGSDTLKSVLPQPGGKLLALGDCIPSASSLTECWTGRSPVSLARLT
jgi:hypothetical protein